MSIRHIVDPEKKVPRHVNSWLEKHIGGYKFEFVERGTKDRTQTWRIATETEMYYLKLFRERQRWQNEVFAYKHWSAAYSPFVPQLCGVYKQNSSQGILTNSMKGKPLRKGNFPSEVVVTVYEEAGKLCRKLEELMIGVRFGFPMTDNILLDDRDSPIAIKRNYDPVEYVRYKFLNLYDLAKKFGALKLHEARKIEIALTNLDVFVNEIPVPVNNDFTPGNWLVDERGSFTSVIDLEHITWSIPVFSLTRLISIYFPHQEDGRLAFYDGYQRNLELEKPEQVSIVYLMDGLRYLVRGIESNESAYVSRGRNIIQKV